MAGRPEAVRLLVASSVPAAAPTPPFVLLSDALLGRPHVSSLAAPPLVVATVPLTGLSSLPSLPLLIPALPTFAAVVLLACPFALPAETGLALPTGVGLSTASLLALVFLSVLLAVAGSTVPLSPRVLLLLTGVLLLLTRVLLLLTRLLLGSLAALGSPPVFLPLEPLLPFVAPLLLFASVLALLFVALLADAGLASPPRSTPVLSSLLGRTRRPTAPPFVLLPVTFPLLPAPSLSTLLAASPGRVLPLATSLAGRLPGLLAALLTDLLRLFPPVPASSPPTVSPGLWTASLPLLATLSVVPAPVRRLVSVVSRFSSALGVSIVVVHWSGSGSRSTFVSRRRDGRRRRRRDASRCLAAWLGDVPTGRAVHCSVNVSWLAPASSPGLDAAVGTTSADPVWTFRGFA